MIGNAFWIQFLWLCMSFLAHTQNTIVVTTVTTAPSQPTNEPSYVDDGAFRDAVLNSTNLFRNEHNASSLAWNDSLTDFGDDYVDGCQWKHSGGPYGENLAQGYEDVSRAVDGWGNERKDYDFNAGQFGETTGHFTQLVWKGTNTVGCGRKFCNGENDVQGWYLVCEYFPRGNIIGSFQANVQSQTNESGTPQSSAASTTSPTVTLTGAPSATSTSQAWRLVKMNATWITIGVVILLNM